MNDRPASSGDEAEDFELLYGRFVGHLHPSAPAPDGFESWVRNLHDVFLNAELASLASIFVPPSDVEESLEQVGGSRRQRLARFVARDMWVLWEAWVRRREFHQAFAQRSPWGVERIRELEAVGIERGWFDRIRQIRDYMNHRDRRDYHDVGRGELPDECLVWMAELRNALSEVLLAAMGIPFPHRGSVATISAPVERNSSHREIAIAAVDDLLIGAVTAMEAGAESGTDAAASIAGHFGRAFVAVACGSPPLWSECVTALSRRAVVAWICVSEFEDLRDVLLSMELDAHSSAALTAVTAVLAEGSAQGAAERSRLAIHRVVAWLNGNGDMVGTLGGMVSVCTIMASMFVAISDDDDPEAVLRRLGSDADDLLDE